MATKAYREAKARFEEKKAGLFPNRVYTSTKLKQADREAKDPIIYTPRGYVYMLGNKSLGFYKIGVTQDLEVPTRRFTSVQQGVPFEIDVTHYWYVKYVMAAERLIHYEFRDRVLRGEWFGFEEQEMPEVIAKIKACLKNDINQATPSEPVSW